MSDYWVSCSPGTFCEHNSLGNRPEQPLPSLGRPPSGLVDKSRRRRAVSFRDTRTGRGRAQVTSIADGALILRHTKFRVPCKLPGVGASSVVMRGWPPTTQSTEGLIVTFQH